MSPVTDAALHRSKFYSGYLSCLSHDITSFYSEPYKYLEPSDVMREDAVSLSKNIYDFMKEFECFSSQHSLKELLVSGFDNEQVWQEIQLQNPSLVKLKSNLSGLDIVSVSLSLPQEQDVHKTKQRKKRIKCLSSEVSNEIDESIEEHIDAGLCGERMQEDEGEDILESRKTYKKTVVDDAFFRLREMEEYMDKLDQLEDIEDGADSGEDYNSGIEIDFFKEGLPASDNDGESANILRYNDFFDPLLPNSLSSKYMNGESHGEVTAGAVTQTEEQTSDLESEDNDNDEDISGHDENGLKDAGKEEDMISDNVGDGDDSNEYRSDENEDVGEKNNSTFERKQKQMQEKIKKLEEENLNEKSWQLMGETVARKRPVNSLLEEFVTFDLTSVGAPVATEETTLSLEELIKQRIKDEAWDDVIRKEKPVSQPYEYKKAPELNQEKSKLSLAEVYEKEYLKQADNENVEKVNEEHTHIQNLMDHLFVQFDALSNFHFTPKPPKPEIKVITNVPSLQMEEVIPITMTEASQLAPEEVFEKKKGELVCADEKKDEDRRRERRRKKIKKRFAAKEKERKDLLKVQKSGKATKSERKQAIDSLKKGIRNTIVNSRKTKKNVKSSNEFFSKLQDEVRNNISKDAQKQRKVAVKKNMSSKSLKL